MKNEPLTTPTDLEIIELLSTGDRQTPANVAAHLDRDSRYMSERLRSLEKREYIQDAPPAERSGMYELTKLGSIVAFHIHTYVRDHHNTFDAISNLLLEEQPETGFYPDLIIIEDAADVALHRLNESEGLLVPSKLEIDIVQDRGYSPQTTGEALYTLSFHGLAERVDGMDVYQITERGERTVEFLAEGVTEPVELTDQLREMYSSDEKERLNALLEAV